MNKRIRGGSTQGLTDSLLCIHIHPSTLFHTRTKTLGAKGGTAPKNDPISMIKASKCHEQNTYNEMDIIREIDMQSLKVIEPCLDRLERRNCWSLLEASHCGYVCSFLSRVQRPPTQEKPVMRCINRGAGQSSK